MKFKDTEYGDLSSKHYEYSIDLNGSRLTSLEGAPSYAGRWFSCSNNSLISLEGGPSYVGGDFSCDDNQLISLSGAPEKVGASFYCYNNQLTSLVGAPISINGDFYCHNNNLTTLEGAPEKVGVDFGDFYCNNNQLTSLKGAPSYIGGEFDCSSNPGLEYPLKEILDNGIKAQKYKTDKASFDYEGKFKTLFDEYTQLEDPNDKLLLLFEYTDDVSYLPDTVTELFVF